MKYVIESLVMYVKALKDIHAAVAVNHGVSVDGNMHHGFSELVYALGLCDGKSCGVVSVV